MNIHIKIFTLSLILLTLFTFGCKNPFNPEATDKDTEIEGLPNNTPMNVLKNLEQAYNQKNLELYKNVLSEDFRFELIASEADEINSGVDLDGDGCADTWWGYQREISYHTNLFRDGSSDGRYPPPDQINLTLEIPQEDLWEEDPEAGHENWWIVTCFFELTLEFYNRSSNQYATGYSTFYLKPENDRWYIAIWRDESFL